MPSGSLKIGKLFGIPVYLHVSLLLILPIFAVVFAFSAVTIYIFPLGYANLPISDISKLIWGIFSAIIFFVSVLAHELAHSVVAVRRGYKISGITLFIFGGISQIEEMPDEAKGEAWMAFVGPFSSIIIGLVFTPLFLVVNGLGNGAAVQAIAITMSIIAFYNILLGFFNLLPAFPMDGGRVLRAELAKRMDFLKATRIAVWVGKYLAIVMAIFGVLFNFWLILIAFFIYIGADEEWRVTQVTTALKGVKVREIMTAEVTTVSPDTPISDVMQRVMTERHIGYPVVQDGVPVGVVTLEDITRIKEQERANVTVGQVMSRALITIGPEEQAVEVFKIMSTKNIGRVLVVQGKNLVGLVTRTDLIRAMDLMLARRKASHGG
ncbi:MAG: CBS domain-containing protein [Methanomassiliicoccales archaeon]